MPNDQLDHPTTVRVLVPESLQQHPRQLIVKVDSDHMHPRLREGDWLHCQSVPPDVWPYMPAGIYVLQTEEQFLLRRVKSNDLGQHAVLRTYADNPRKEKATDIPRAHLSQIWQVLEIVSGTIR